MASCSDFSEQQQESMIGTAGHYAQYLILEAKLPWKDAILESRDALDIAPMMTQMTEVSRFRPLLIAPEQESKPNMRYVVWLQLDADQRVYVMQEYLIPRSLENELLPAIIQQTIARLPYMFDSLKRLVLVCVDGAHDTCCGTKGYPLFRELVRHYADDQSVSIRRCSHLGGHRFAPTCASFPEGRYYGRIKLEQAHNLLDKRLSWQEILPMYRGNGCLTPKEQHIEAYLLGSEGEGADTSHEKMAQYDVLETGQATVFGSCGDPAERQYSQYRVAPRKR